jgi:glycine betaine/choline ABC-type transport system substrate-binding protein
VKAGILENSAPNVGKLGLNNTYASPSCRKPRNIHISTCSDLIAAAPQLTFGAESNFFAQEL